MVVVFHEGEGYCMEIRSMGFLRDGWCFDVVRGPYGVSLWKKIRIKLGNFSKFILFKVGDCTQIWVWQSRIGDARFKDTFPELFQVALDEDVLMEEYTYYSSEFSLEANVFSKRCKIGNQSPWFHFLKYLTKVHQEGEDKMIWTPARSHGFDVKSYYMKLKSGGGSSFSWKQFGVPPK
jgi:hypothetical protein